MTPFSSLAKAAHLPFGEGGVQGVSPPWAPLPAAGQGPALEAGAPPSWERAQSQTKQGQGVFVASTAPTMATRTFCLALGPSHPDSGAFAQCRDTASS